MATFTLTFEMDNGAFHEDMEGETVDLTEVVSILRDTATKIEGFGLEGRNVRDHNGNHVGRWSVTE